MSLDGTFIFQWINSNQKQPILVANRVREILEYTSVDQWNHDATKIYPGDAETRETSFEVLRLSSLFKGSHFPITSSFLLAPNKEAITNIKFGVTDPITIDDILTMVMSVKKQTNPFPLLFPFDKFSSFQKY